MTPDAAVVSAWVKLSMLWGAAVTPEAVRAFCRGKIASHKVPRYVELVDAFPLTISGKAQKFLMRADVERRLRLRGPNDTHLPPPDAAAAAAAPTTA